MGLRGTVITTVLYKCAAVTQLMQPPFRPDYPPTTNTQLATQFTLAGHRKLIASVQ